MLLGLLVLGAAAMTASPAAAHAVLERATPAPGSRLEAPPRQLVLRFTEPVDASFSGAVVRDAAGATVSGRAATGADGRTVVVPLRSLGTGVYTVRWRVLSLVDGHQTAGAFVFAVGQEAPGALGTSAPSGAVATPPAVLVGARWTATAAAMVLFGATWVRATLAAPTLPALAAAAAGAALGRLRRLTMAAAGTLVAATAVDVVAQASLAFDQPALAVVARGGVATFLVSTRPGQSALWRAALALVLLAPPSPSGRILQLTGLLWLVLVGLMTTALGGLSALGSAHGTLVVLTSSVYGMLGVLAASLLPQIRDVRVPAMRPVPLATAALLLLGFTLSSHAAGAGVVAGVVDWVHLVAAATWLGGLAAVVVAVAPASAPERAALAAVLVPRASRVAAVALGAVAVTGAYAAGLHVPGLRALVDTLYGRGLLVKALLVAAVAALGAVNRFRLVPQVLGAGVAEGARPADPTAAGPLVLLQPPDPAAATRSPTPRSAAADAPPHATGAALAGLLRVVRLELAVAALVVGVATVIALAPPARTVSEQQAASASVQRPLVFASLVGGLRVGLVVAPAGAPGWSRYEVTARYADGRPLDPDSRVLLRFVELAEETEVVVPTLRGAGPGRAVGEGAELAVAGWWELVVTVRRRGQPDVVLGFPFVAGPQRPAPDPQAQRLLERARAAMAAARTWREEEHLTDGAGGALTAHYEIRYGDRLRLRTSTGVDLIRIGQRQYLREPGAAWVVRDLEQGGPIEGALGYTRGAQGARLGRRLPCGDATCQIVLWDAPDQTAAFAAWIGLADGRIHRLLMAAPAHYMALRAYDFGAALLIEPPRGGPR
ncbi:MAG: copper resistance protein CopC [Armatimonadota bacterium]|nr:copper resistance protein CopC [Armatimonadota bacterium]